MKHYSINPPRVVGEKNNRPSYAYRVCDNGDVQHWWRGQWVDCAYFCEEELVADGATPASTSEEWTASQIANFHRDNPDAMKKLFAGQNLL